MNTKILTRRIPSLLIAAVFAVIMLLPCASAFAANTQFITDIKLAAGADAVDKLEADGYSVMLTGLNMTSEPSKQVYMGYKMNAGKPITNIIISNGGDSVKDNNGISYSRAGDVDVDAGIGSAGFVYITRDAKAGSPLVGLDVLRSKKEPLYPITNDGAEIVRTAKGAPADLEKSSKKAVIYLAQIRDGIVRPYISEIGIVSDKDKWNAVYTACERGYNYFVEGDIDKSDETYTILVYKRTADVKDAVTNITAVSQKAVDAMVKVQSADAKLNGNAISISGVEYVRVSGKPIAAKQPYYLYQTKNAAAGNPVSMLYAEKLETEQNSLFGTWVDGYFSSVGKTSSYMFSANEDLYASLREDLTVMTMLPVRLLEKTPAAERDESETTTEKVTETTTEATTEETTEVTTEVEEPSGDDTDSEDASEESTEETTTEKVTETTTEKETTTEATTETEENKVVKIVMLTPRDGLPESAAEIMGLSDSHLETPVVERTERSDRTNKLGASVFGKHGGAALVLGCVAVVGAGVATVIIRKKKSNEAR